MNSNLKKIYDEPIKSTRSGSLFMAFSYPTKISPETIAVYILAHTKPGDTVLDVFGGSGTTGLATLLCDKPNDGLKKLVLKANIKVEYGPRTAYISELSGLGAFVSEVMTSKISSSEFKTEAHSLLERVKERIQSVYETLDENGDKGFIRHIIHTDYLICSNCNHEISFGDACVKMNPINILSKWTCPDCGSSNTSKESKRVQEKIYDPIINQEKTTRKRRPYIIYGQTNKVKWKRKFNDSDNDNEQWFKFADINSIPKIAMEWGDLYRSGYHEGINYLHDFYSNRNLAVLSVFWDELKNAKSEFQNSLKLWILSYNSSHATLMTRVVLKKNQTDFVLTGAQPGVLYVSSLPVEKNIVLGLLRKIETFSKAFELVEGSKSNVHTIWGSSTSLEIKDKSIDYVFTDPPFGDYIPYSELNFINEAWLNRLTIKKEEAIISKSQNKDANSYEHLLSTVFSEVNRVLKDKAYVSVIFHSASSKVWNALKSTFKNSDLNVIYNSVLQKEQASFKQTNSNITVKGDAVLLLTKGHNSIDQPPIYVLDLIKDLIAQAKLMKNPLEELENERLYSRYVGFCMSNQFQIELDAKDFYLQLNECISK